MSDELRKQIYGSLNQKETVELIKIWQTNNNVEWTDMAFDVIREILQERLVELPPQGNPVLEEQEVIKIIKGDLAKARESGDRDQEAINLANLGAVYLNKREVERAIELYEQALTLFRQVGNRTQEAAVLFNMGTANLFLGWLKRALDYDHQALAICRETGNLGMEGMVLEILGQIYFAMNQVDKAIESTHSAVTILDEIGDPRAGHAREQLNHFSAQKSKQNRYRILVPIGLIILLIILVVSSTQKHASNSSPAATIEQKERVSLEEIYRDVPANSAEQTKWDQWQNKYEGTNIKETGKLEQVMVFPQEGKLFLIFTQLGEGGAIETNPTQAALFVEDAQDVRFGEEEGSFLVNSLFWIYLGESYAFEGRVFGISLFDPELVSSGYRDLVIVNVKMIDLKKE